jgi:carbon storage regulator
MLILTRKLNEKILINGKQIVVMVTEVRDHSIKLGIQAPKEIPILRKEIADRYINT